MASKPAEFPILSWAPPASPLRIEYSTEVMEEVRARAVEGYYKLVRGGVEIAGLLLGEVHDDSIRILAQLPFEIEYAYGPVFSLSPRDHAFIRKLVEDCSNRDSAAVDSGTSLRVLGLYVSHARSGMSLTNAELDLFQKLFPHAWQVCLILKPSRSPGTPAGFFVREVNGEVKIAQPHEEFLVSPVMGERRARPARSEDASLQALAEAARHAEQPGAHDVPRGSTLSSDATPQPGPSPSILQQARIDAMRNASQGGEPQPPTSDGKEEPFALSAPPFPHGDDSSESRSRPEPLETREWHPAEFANPSSELQAPETEEVPEAVPGPFELANDGVPWDQEELDQPSGRVSAWRRWAIPGFSLLLLLVLGYLVYQAFNSAPPTVLFYTRDVGDSLEVVWQLTGLSDARSAVITIRTGSDTRRIDLMRTGQLSGTYRDPIVQRNSEISLDVERDGGEAIHRTAPLIASDSVVMQLDDQADTRNAAEADNTTADTVPESVIGTETDTDKTPKAPMGVIASDPIPATPVESKRLAESNNPRTPAPQNDKRVEPSSRAQNDSPREPTAREQIEQRSALARSESNAPTDRSILPPTQSSAPEAPVQARITETPPSAGTHNPVPNVERSSSGAGQGNAANTPSLGAQAAPLTSGRQEINRPQPASAAPARAQLPTRVPAGRVIWTGQLRKNDSLQIAGQGANKGVVNASLPGQPVRISVLPGELTSQGLIVYTANPKYRNTQNSEEPPGSTNGWNRTRYRYDPARANSLIVTAIPNQTNNWQGITVRNDDKNINVVVIDWQAVEP